jgi:hypothetical protein
MQREAADHMSPQEAIRVALHRSTDRPHSDRIYDLPRGVSVAQYGKYQAIFRGKFLGSFDTPEEASFAYQQAAGPKRVRELGSYLVDRRLLQEAQIIAWCKSSGGYWKARIAGDIVLMHHWAWRLYGGQEPKEGEVIDHVDGDRTNNSSSNLRLTTYAGNSLNTSGSCVRFVPSKRSHDCGTWGVRIKAGKGKCWSRNYKDESVARLVAKHRKQLMIEREVIAYVS